jgi:hypothetical protein
MEEVQETKRSGRSKDKSYIVINNQKTTVEIVVDGKSIYFTPMERRKVTKDVYEKINSKLLKKSEV